MPRGSGAVGRGSPRRSGNAAGQDPPYEAPPGWKWLPIGSLCNLINGRAFKAQDWTTSGLPIIRIQNLNNPDKPFNHFAGSPDRRHLVKDGDVLISWSGTPGTSFGAFHWKRGPGVLNQHIFRVELAGSWLDPAYFVHAVNLRLDELIRRAQGGVGLRHITRGELDAVTLPVPHPDEPDKSLATQRRIVARIDGLLTEVREARRLLGEMVRDIDWLLPAAFEEFICVETRARTLPLAGVATAFNGRASGEGTSLVRVFKTKHVYPHALRMDRPSFAKAEQVAKFPRDRFLRPGDVLMANIAEGTLGRVTYVPEAEEDWTVDTQVMILRPLDERRLLAKWLYYYLWSARGQQEILSRRSGIAFADKRGQTHIYPKNVLEIPVPVPSIDRQREAVAVLDSIRQQSSEARQILAQKSTLLDRLEQSILERAFRGEL